MRYVFFGGQESQFAQIILDGLKSAGWPPLAEVRDAKKPLDIPYLKSLGADFFLVAAFGKILKKEILNIRPIIAVHPSLLPKYRGPSPIQSAILNDEKETGVTLFLIDEKVDHGLILSNVQCPMSDVDTYEFLQKKLAELSVPLILETVPKYLSGELKPSVQNESEASYTKKFTAVDAEVSSIGLIRPLGAISSSGLIELRPIWLKIRALNPEPGVFTILKLENGKTLRLKLLEAELRPTGLILKTVQPGGKKPMDYKSFLNGYQKLL